MGKRMQMHGIVIGDNMPKTVVVEVRKIIQHPLYGKNMVRKTKVYAHTGESLPVGTNVIVEESKPISKLKRWVVVQVIKDKK